MTKHPRQLAYATLQTNDDDEDDEEYYVTTDITIPYEDDNEAEHNSSGFCNDMTCPCHEDSESIDGLNQAVVDGEASPDDADRIYRGKTF
jgi:hypothetical protein